MGLLAAFCGSLAALVLVLAAASKLGRRTWVVAIVRNYDLVPSAAAPAVARLLPIIEVCVGAALFLRLAPGFTGPAAAALFLLFGAAIAVNLLRGRTNIACGCFGPHENAPLSWFQVVRNVGLASCALMAAPMLEIDAGRLSPLAADQIVGTLAAAVLLICWWLGSVAADALRKSRVELSSQS
jgi:hypothetical protein